MQTNYGANGTTVVVHVYLQINHLWGGRHSNFT